MSETIVVGAPAPDLLTKCEGMLQLAKGYSITCPEMREAASEDLKRVKALYKDVEQQRKDITNPLDIAKKRVMDLFRGPLQFLESAEATLKRACIAYDDEQERQRRNAEAEAARKADQERQRLAKLAEAERQAGNAEAAHVIAEAATMVAPIPVVSEKPKISGESTRDTWHAEVEDLVALAKAVAEGKVSPENLLPNMPVLNQQARALKQSLAIPGVKSVCERVLAARAA